jgi:hypothetical protein
MTCATTERGAAAMDNVVARAEAAAGLAMAHPQVAPGRNQPGRRGPMLARERMGSRPAPARRRSVRPQVRWHWVKGHVGHALNERADLLAVTVTHDAARSVRGAPATGGARYELTALARHRACVAAGLNEDRPRPRAGSTFAAEAATRHSPETAGVDQRPSRGGRSRQRFVLAPAPIGGPAGLGEDSRFA